MFVETKEAGEVVEAPAKVLKPSEAIRVGAQLVTPDPAVCYFSTRNDRACLVGLALVGRTGSLEKALVLREEAGGTWHAIKKLFGTGKEIGEKESPLRKAERMFMHDGKSVDQCADYLEAQGY